MQCERYARHALYVKNAEATRQRRLESSYIRGDLGEKDQLLSPTRAQYAGSTLLLATVLRYLCHKVYKGVMHQHSSQLWRFF